MRTTADPILTDEKYQQIASLANEKLDAFNNGDLDVDTKIAIASEMRSYYQLLIDYDNKLSRPSDNVDRLNQINNFLDSTKNEKRDIELTDWVIINTDNQSSISHLEKLPLVILLKIYSYLSIEETGKASAVSKRMHRMVEPDNIAAQSFWKTKMEGHFTTAFKKIGKRKVNNWYVELVRTYIDTYKYEKTNFLDVTKEIPLPSRLRKAASMIKEGDLNSLIEANISFEEIILLFPTRGSFIIKNQKVKDYIYKHIILPAYTKQPRRKSVLKLIEDGDTLLFWAVRFSQYDSIEKLDGTNEEISSLFCYSICSSKVKEALICLDRGVDVNGRFRDFHGRLVTALYLVAESGNIDNVKFLLSHGADLSIPCYAKDHKYRSLDDHSTTPLFAAAKNGHTDVVLLLLEKGADPNILYKFELTAIQKAAQSGHLNVVKALVEHGVNVNSFDKRYEPEPNYLPVYYAVRNQHSEMVEYLIEHGADLSCKIPKPLLEVAIRTGNKFIVNILLRCKKIEVIERDYELAIKLKYYDIAESLSPYVASKFIIEPDLQTSAVNKETNKYSAWNTLFRKKEYNDIGFPKSIREALQLYDRNKSTRRSLFGDQNAIKNLRNLPIEKRCNREAIMKCFEGQILKEGQASYGVYHACCELIINANDRNTSTDFDKLSAESTSMSENSSACEIALETIWALYKSEKDVCTIMQQKEAYSNKKHAQQDHDYYTGLIKDRINSNILFCCDQDARNNALEVIDQLTTDPLKDVHALKHTTISQLLFLLDHAANHPERADRENTACALYKAISQLRVDKELDLSSLIRIFNLNSVNVLVEDKSVNEDSSGYKYPHKSS